MNVQQAALGDEIRAEMARQRIPATEMQRRAGITHASWRNWFVTAKNAAPMPEVWAVADVLGVPLSELVRRAEVRLAGAPRDTAAELVEGLPAHVRKEMETYRRPPKPKAEGGSSERPTGTVHSA